MRAIVLSVLFMLVSWTVSAQVGGKTDARLQAKFSEEEIKDMAKENPAGLEFWTFYLDHGYSIMEMPQGKGGDLPTVSIADLNDFNVLSLGLEPQQAGNRYFRIESTGQLLAIHSISEVKSKLPNK